jgi:hypothetical protein
MLSKLTPHPFIAALVAAVFSIATQSVAQQSPSQPPVHLKAPSGSPVYDDSQSPVDQDIQLLRKNLRSQEKQIVAANINLTDSDAQKFWPLYDRFASDLSTIYDRKIALVNEYMETYQTMTGDQAEDYIRRRAAVEEDVMQLRLKYVPAFRRVLSGRQAALFFQIEWRLDLMINLQLAQIPMIDP